MPYYRRSYINRKPSKKEIDSIYKRFYFNMYKDSKYKDREPNPLEFNIEDINQKIEVFEKVEKYYEIKNDDKRKQKWINSKVEDIAKEIKTRSNVSMVISFILFAMLYYLIAVVLLKQDIKSMWLVLAFPLNMFPIAIVNAPISSLIVGKREEEIRNKRNQYSNYYDNELEKRFKPYLIEKEKYEKYEKALEEYRYWRNIKQSIYWEEMDGREFEENIASMFKMLDFEVDISRVGADGGVDIIVKKNNYRYAVQCKAHHEKISEGVARDLYGVLHAKKFDAGYLVSLSGVSKKTVEFCKSLKDKPIFILSEEDILNIINNDKPIVCL